MGARLAGAVGNAGLGLVETQYSRVIAGPPAAQDGRRMATACGEAQATGNLVIASRVGGIPESVLDATTGILTEAGNPFLLAEAIESSVLDKDKYKMLRKRWEGGGRGWSVFVIILPLIPLHPL